MNVTNLGCTCRAMISENNEADLIIPHAARFLVGSAHGRLLRGHATEGRVRHPIMENFREFENQLANTFPWKNFGNSKLFHIFLAISCDQDMIHPR